MKISELIKCLQDAKEKYGDMSILMDSNTYGFDVNDGMTSPKTVTVSKHTVTKEEKYNLCDDVPVGDYLFIDPLGLATDH